MIINVQLTSCKLPSFLVRFLINLEFSCNIFKKYSNIKFHESPSSERQVVPCRWTDRHDQANSHFLKFVNMHKEGLKL